MSLLQCIRDMFSNTSKRNLLRKVAVDAARFAMINISFRNKKQNKKIWKTSGTQNLQTVEIVEDKMKFCRG